MINYLNEYISELSEEKQRASNTIDSYGRDIKKYLIYIEKAGIKEFSENDGELLKSYTEELENEGKAPATILRVVVSLRSFYAYLLGRGIINMNPTLGLEAPRVEKKAPKILTRKEAERLMSQPEDDEKGCRDRAMLELLYVTGMRVSELINLDVGDVSVEFRIIRCRNPKGDRIIPIGKSAAAVLDKYLSEMRENILKNKDEQALFVNCDGGRISRQGFWKLIKKYQSSAGITKEITLHTLRHSFEAHLLENGADMRYVREMIGFDK